MPSWKKVLVSGSNIHVAEITASRVPTVDNENNLLAISANGGITQITQGSVAGTNPTFTIEAFNSSSITTTDFTATGSLIFSHSFDHGFGFTLTDSGTTSSISLQTPQDLQTTAGPLFASITASNGIAHAGDTDTRIEFVDDQILFHAGGVKLLSLVEGGTDNVVINQDSNDVDFRVEGNTDTHLLFVDGGNDKIAIGTSTVNASSLLTVSGTIHATGITSSLLPSNTDSTTVIVDGGSGKLEKRDINDLVGAGDGLFNSASIIGTDNEIEVTFPSANTTQIGIVDNPIIGGGLTVNGDISASGDVTASNIQLFGDLALGGNIFSFSGFSFIEGVSAVFTGSNIFGSGSTPGANDTAGGGIAHQFTGSVSITGSNLTVVDGGITAEGGTGLFGSVTSLGNISASGNLFAALPLDTTPLTEIAVYNSTTGQLFYTSSQGLSDTLDTFKTTGQRDGNSSITGSLVVSGSSGLIEIDNNAIKGLTTVPGGQPSIVLNEDGFEFNQVGQGGSALAKFRINGTNENVDFQVDGKTVNDLLKVSASESRVEIRNSLSVLGDGHITASGDISGSGALFASLSLDNSSGLKVVVFDTSSGKFFFTGSYGGAGGGVTSYNDLSDIPSTIVSASVLSSPGQGEAILTINGVAGSTVDLGLQTNDNVEFADLKVTGNATIDNNATIGGNLTVNGTMTSISSTNLQVEDTFILLASGSAAGGSLNDGGIIVEQTTSGTGTALFFDTSQNIWAIDQAGADHTNDATVSADVTVATVQLAGLAHGVNNNTNPPTTATILGNDDAAEKSRKGSFFVDIDDDFGLYVYM
jgi:hypothetical protein